MIKRKNSVFSMCLPFYAKELKINNPLHFGLIAITLATLALWWEAT